MWILWWIAGVAIVATLVFIRKTKYYIFEYLFFLRVPILAGAILFIIPFLATREGPSQFAGNLFVLDSDTLFWGAFLTAFWACVVAYTVMSVGRLVYLTVPARCRLPFSRRDYARWKAERWLIPESQRNQFLTNLNRQLLNRSALVRWLVRLRILLFALLAVPAVVAIVSQSVDTGRVMLAALLGVFAAASLWLLGVRVGQLFLAYRAARPPGHWAKNMDTRLDARAIAGFEGQGHLRVVAFASLIMLVYVVGYFLLRPGLGDRMLATRVPAIAYVLILLVMLTWFFSVLSLLLDKWRIPILFAFVAFLVFAFGQFRTDHYYRVVERTASLAPTPTVPEAVSAWAGRHSVNDRPTMVVVTASGGGITAAYWTATVFRQLQQELGPLFSQSIVAVSTTSGGGAGAMYYVDAYRESGGPPDSLLSDIVEAAGTSSLAAITWGFVYPDLPRFLTGGATQVLTNEYLDRGWALETRWLSRGLSADRTSGSKPSGRQTPRMLSDWEDGVRSGWRPAQIFNATITESGAPLLLATVDLPSDDPGPRPGSIPKEFVDEYRTRDVSVVTAARLSATFPWVSPIARPLLEESSGLQAFHVVDGGYFDNSGVYSAIRFLQAIASEDYITAPEYFRTAIGRDRVLLIEIRATGEGRVAAGAGGLAYSLAGPMITMNNVRMSSQIARNDLELRMLQELWARDSVSICRVVFELNIPAPMSWHLSEDEKAAIESAWDQLRFSNRIRPLRTYLQGGNSRLPGSRELDCG